MPTTSVAALRDKRAAAAGKCWVDVAFWGGAVPGNADSLLPLHQAGVVGFKCFLLDSGVPEFPPLDSAGLNARVEGTVSVKTLTKDYVDHLIEDGAKIEKRNADGTITEVSFEASGVELTKGDK